MTLAAEPPATPARVCPAIPAVVIPVAAFPVAVFPVIPATPLIRAGAVDATGAAPATSPVRPPNRSRRTSGRATPTAPAAILVLAAIRVIRARCAVARPIAIRTASRSIAGARDAAVGVTEPGCPPPRRPPVGSDPPGHRVRAGSAR